MGIVEIKGQLRFLIVWNWLTEWHENQAGILLVLKDISSSRHNLDF